MTIEPPQPPTAPAPALRPTPPTPPRIDRSPFAKDRGNDDTPEAQARDAVANGSGALTKRTVDKGDTQPDPPNQTVTVIPPDAPIIPDSQSDYDRGKDVLREFSEMDAHQADSTPAQSSSEQSRPVTPNFNHQEGHGGAFWIFTIIFVAVASFVIVKKFLLTDKPALTKSQLFEDSSSRLQAATDKVKPVTESKPVTTSKPARTVNTSNKKATTDKIEPVKPPPTRSPKKDDDKGKHFEVRV